MPTPQTLQEEGTWKWGDDSAIFDTIWAKEQPDNKVQPETLNYEPLL